MTEKGGLAGWVYAPLNTLPRSLRSVLVVVFTVLIVGSSALLQRRLEAPFQLPDADQYVSMAKGQIRQVPQPFASRPLSPLLARGVSSVLHVSVETAFVLLAYLSLVCTLLVVFWLAMRSSAPRWVLLLLVSVAFWPELLHGLALPDIGYTALLCGLLLALEADRPMVAAILLFPLMVSRESTALTLVCLLIAGWRRLQWPGTLLAIGCTLAGAALVHHLSAGAVGNQEHLPQPLYLAAKVPWNLVRLTGITPWSNLYPFLCGTPEWQHALHIGPLRTVGVCEVSPISPLQAGMALLTTFGLLPALCVLVWRHRGRKAEPDLLLRFCLVYGGISFALAPMLGTWYSRLFGYAWPLFLVALPRLYAILGQDRHTIRAGWAGLSVVLAFLALHVGLTALVFSHERPAVLLWAAILQAAGVALLCSPWRRTLGCAKGQENASSVVKSS